MLKIVFCLRRRPDMSREQFQTYWREVHAPLVARHADALNIVRYVQNHTLPEDMHARLPAGRGNAPGYDGVAELWIDEAPMDDAQRARARQANAELLEDERRFIDLERSSIFYVREDVRLC